MKREFLKELLKNVDEAEAKTIIDSIMAEHGKGIQELKDTISTLETEKTNAAKELKAANDTIKTLQKGNEENEDLQKQIGDYKATIDSLKKEHAAELSKLNRASIENELLSKYKAKNNAAAKALIGEIEAKDDEDYKTLFEAKLKAVSEAQETSFAFGEPETRTSYNPKSGGGSSVNNPFAKETFNLTEQGRMLKENPTQARELAAAAGITL